MVQRVEDTLDRFLIDHSIDRELSYGLAFSGGSDSLALLIALLVHFESGHIYPFYVNHRLRDERELEAEVALNRENCSRLGVELTVLDLHEGVVEDSARERMMGVEEAARTLRYRALLDACTRGGLNGLFTAHNSDDQLETLLMRLGQGGAVSTLASIRAVRLDERTGLAIYRPLLGITHSDLRSYADEAGFHWSTDSTNDEQRFLRNAIRYRVKVPFLSLFPTAREHANTITQRLTHLSDFIAIHVQEALTAAQMHEGRVMFDHRWYRALHPAVAEPVLYRLVETVRGKQDGRIKATTISWLSEALLMWHAEGRTSEREGDLLLVLDGSHCTLSRESVCWSYCAEITEPQRPQQIDLGSGLALLIEAYDREDWDGISLCIDASLLDMPVVRSPHFSDEILLEGGRIEVGKLLSSMKIPRHLRPMVAILADRSGVVAVFGQAFGGRDRLAKRFKAPLAHRFTNIYSSNRRNEYSEI